MSKCTVCHQEHEKQIIFNNQIVCHRCDELTLDIEMESDFIERRKHVRVSEAELLSKDNTEYLRN